MSCKDEYIDEDGDIWTRKNNGITCQNSRRRNDRDIYMQVEGRWMAFDTELDHMFKAQVSTDLLNAAWAALKGDCA